MAAEKSLVEPGVVVTTDGPYIVSGNLPLSVKSITPNADGGSWTWTDGTSLESGSVYALCRCGGSAKKPFCDGTHARIGFDGTETADRAPFVEQAKRIDGPTLELRDAEALCAFARFCDNAGGIWTLVTQTEEAGVEATVVHEGTNCPSGRLVLRDKRADHDVETTYAPSVVLVEDPEKKSSGPIWFRGGIPVRSQDGTPYEVRNRVTLCRCGRSSNKPFCDGTHADIGFDDGLMPKP